MMSGYKKPSSFGRFVRFIFAAVILSALVLGIAYGVKFIYKSDINSLALQTKNLLAKFNINVDEKKVGEVAGKFVERVSQTNLGSGVSISRDTGSNDNTAVSGYNKKVLLKMAVLADVHEDLQNLEKALKIAGDKGVKYVVVVGDITNYGDVAALEKVKNVLEKSGAKYFILPGDHDLAQSVSVDNFKQVFGADYNVEDLYGVKFLLLDNSFNYSVLPAQEISWLQQNIDKTDFVFMSQPLYTSGLSSFFEKIYMGSTTTAPETEELKQKQEAVKDQGVLILNLIRSQSSVKAVFSGEHHKSSKQTDPNRTSLEHYVVGAVSSTVNDYPQSIIQTPRFSLLTIYEDKTYQVEDVVID